MPAALTAETSAAFPTLSLMVSAIMRKRASTCAYVELTRLPAELSQYPEHVFGTAPRAADKRKGLAAARRELAALAGNPVAEAELSAAYKG
jgi:hypothetical protein